MQGARICGLFVVSGSSPMRWPKIGGRASTPLLRRARAPHHPTPLQQGSRCMSAQEARAAEPADHCARPLAHEDGGRCRTRRQLRAGGDDRARGAGTAGGPARRQHPRCLLPARAGNRSLSRGARRLHRPPTRAVGAGERRDRSRRARADHRVDAGVRRATARSRDRNPVADPEVDDARYREDRERCLHERVANQRRALAIQDLAERTKALRALRECRPAPELSGS